MRRLVSRFMVASLLATSTVAAAAAVSNAATAGCPPDPAYSVSGAVYNHKDLVPYSSAPGGHTLGITITAGASVSATFSGALQTEESIIIASAKETFGLSFTMTLTASISYSDSWKVPDTWAQGQLHAGADRKSFHWSYGHYAPTCNWVVVRSGTSNAPYHLPAFWSVRG